MKKLLSILLALTLLFSAVPHASAAVPTLANFSAVQSYGGAFADVPEGAWYATDVARAYELGLVKGRTATSFAPKGEITISEALALACRLHSIYYTGTAEFVQGTPWYRVYVDYAVANSILATGQYDYTAKATRAQFAQIFANVLPDAAMPYINDIADDYIPDVTADMASYDAVYKLYRAGILQGNDAIGTFQPNAYITRAEVATIVTRMALEEQRKAFRPGVAEIIKARKMGLIPAAWEGDLQAEADFAGYYQLLGNFVRMYDASSAALWQSMIFAGEFPDREMKRDDALVLLLLTAEALQIHKDNARDYGFCVESEVNMDLLGQQLSWEYPYCDSNRETGLLTNLGTIDPIGVVPITAQFFLVRSMDLYQRVHFLDCDETLNFHLDEVLTKEAAIAAVVRLYHSATMGYDAYMGFNQMTAEEQAAARESIQVQTLSAEKDAELKANLQAAIDEILNTKTEIVRSDTHIPGETYSGTAYYVSADGDDGNDGLTPETAWRTLQHVMTEVGGTEAEPTIKAGDAVFLRRGDTFRMNDSAFIIESDGITFSAYGEGAKPIITASSESGTGAEKWKLVYEDTDGVKIWEFYHDMRDVGMIVLNDGEFLANRVYEYGGENGYISCHYERWSMEGELNGNGVILEDRLFSLEETLTENLTIVSRPAIVDSAPTKGPLYLRCDEGNPGEIFSSIEFAEGDLLGIVWLKADNTVFDNLSFRCGGIADVKNGKLDVRTLVGTIAQNCEFAYGGGSVAFYPLNELGEPCIGVQSDGFFGPVSNTTLRHNYMHDSQGGSVTYETGPDDIGREPAAGYFRLLDNVVVNTYGLRLDSLDEAIKYLDALIIQGNQLWNIGHYDNGYAFYADGAIYAMINHHKEFVIADNIIYGTENGPDNALLNIFAFDYEAKFYDYTKPRIENNVFVQYKGRRFADFEYQDNDTWYLEDRDFAEKMYYFFGETNSEYYIAE